MATPTYGDEYEDLTSTDEKRAHFTLSAASSRSASPAPDHERDSSDDYSYYDGDSDSDILLEKTAPSDVYDATLPWWRAAIRRKLVKIVDRESKIIAKMQSYIRTPFLDSYFVYTSTLGTHTFFMIILPAFFFFGIDKAGRGLLIILALGVYFASVLKDLICSPRPFAPPVTRLTIGTHHLEYGFPSTHSTNSVSIALTLWSEIYRLYHTDTPSLSPEVYTFFCVVLWIYAVSIVFGRLYTAMHSFADCIAGVAIGAGIWWTYESFPGWAIVLPSWTAVILKPFGATQLQSGSVLLHFLRSPAFSDRLESWVQSGGYSQPLILVVITLLAVNQHPQPVDDCPCFEDAIAFSGVVLGAIVGRWAAMTFDPATKLGVVPGSVIMPGSGWVMSQTGWTQVERTLWDVLLWWGVAALKMVLGILVIFIWRILAKSLLHIILPPFFRLLAKAFELPNRRFYTPATDYKSVPSEFNAEGGLRPIPSVIDLPLTGEEIGGIGSGSAVRAEIPRGKVTFREKKGSALKGQGDGYVPSGLNPHVHNHHHHHHHHHREEEDADEKEETVKHYDADVLTKVFVYSGIAVFACEIIPLGFDLIGLGTRSSPL